MPIYKLEGNNIIKLKRTTFSEEKISEARDLQKFIINSIEILERNLFVISSEFGDWEDSRRRIDILCLDKNANLVVVELKITEDGGHMELQSIRYAAMIANMTFDKAEKAFHSYIKKNNLPIENPKEAILNFLEWDDVNEEDFANDVRIILVSANFKEKQKYQLTVPKSTVYSYYESNAQSIRFDFEADEIQNYGSFTLRLANKPTSKFWVQLLNADEKVMYSKYTSVFFLQHFLE